MSQPAADQNPDTGSAAATGRLAAAGGAGFLVASVASDLVIGKFPGPGTSAGKLVAFYATHHGQVLAGGWLLALSGVFFALFGTAAWARIRQAAGSPLLAGLTLTGTVLVAVTTLDSAGTYGVLGDIGGLHAVLPAALQAWHILGSEGSLAGTASTVVFLLAVAGAGLLARAMPRSLGWSALVLALLQLVPGQLGFLASLVFLLWAAVAGTVLLFARRTGSPAPARAPQAAARSAAGSSPAAPFDRRTVQHHPGSETPAQKGIPSC
jgi:hypothetical protein